MTTPRTGPLESQRWPDQLDALAVTPLGSPRLFGYDVDSDLARHVGFADIVFLAVTGDLPTEARSRGFELALTMLAPMSVPSTRFMRPFSLASVAHDRAGCCRLRAHALRNMPPKRSGLARRTSRIRRSCYRRRSKQRTMHPCMP